MVLINVAQKEISCKIVYYGPGLCGKTTNIQVVHDKAPAENKGKLTSLATEGDRTLFFDFLPLDLGSVGGMRTKFQLYTVPGQVFYNATRKLVLRGADGVIFVADSSADKMKENIESLDNLIGNLKEQGIDINEVPLVFQWNKRDLPSAVPEEDLQKALNRWSAPAFNAIAVKGEGVFATLKCISGLVLDKISRKMPQRGAAASAAATSAAPAAPPPAAAARTPAPAVEPPSKPVPPPTPTVAPARPSVSPAQAIAAKAGTAAQPVPPAKRPVAAPAVAERPATPRQRPSAAVAAARPGASPFAPRGVKNIQIAQPVSVGKAPTQGLDQRISWAIFGVIVVALVGAILYLLFK